MIRCPVCESTSVRIVLSSTRRATCSACGARWVQEGSWQRHVRPHQPVLPFEPELEPVVEPAEILALADASPVAKEGDDVTEAIAT